MIKPGWFAVEESRDAGPSLDRFPEHLATLGLPALALLFHPWHVDEFHLACEGFSDWRGYPAWQVRFEQRSDRPQRMRSYRIGTMVYPVKLKGRAWIAANSYQVLHLDADLLEPIPKIRLHSEHISVDYHPVQFQTEKLELWLPNRADVYFDFRGHRYHRRHSFSKYMLFSVDTSQQIRDPDVQ